MGLIEEALRRAEGVITSPTHPDARVLMIAENAAPLLSLRSFFISGLIVSAGVLSWWLVWSGHVLRTSSPPTPVATTLPVQRIIPPTGMETSPHLPKIPQPTSALIPYRLSGIVLGPGTPIAVINDRILHLGETINGLRVATVSRSSVILEHGMTRITLRLGD